MKTKKTIMIAAQLALLLLIIFFAVSDSAKQQREAEPSPAAAGVVEIPDFEESAEPEPAGAVIAFTFDDGYASDYELAYPILKKYGIRGTSYIIPLYQDTNRAHALTWDEIREMSSYGWVFGCHTYAHTNVADMTPDEIVQSMKAVNAAFEKQGLPVPVIHAFPYGKYDEQAIDAMKPFRLQMREAFYETKFIDLSNVDPYEIDSCSADMRTEKRLLEHEAVVDKACSTGGVIVFRCHCLYREKPGDMGDWPVQTDSRLFGKLVEYCVKKGCRFVTMTELINMYSVK
jgi:peptidoglycan/xylan/chitin deacetylase (PgdA/CDA1 family)